MRQPCGRRSRPFTASRWPSDARRCPAMGRSSPAPRHGRPPSWRNGEESEAGERANAARREREGPGHRQHGRRTEMQSVTLRSIARTSRGLSRWQSRLRGCGATRRYASVAVTGHAVFGRSLRAGFSAAISAPLRFSLPSLSPPLAGARCALRLPGRRPRPASQSRNRTGRPGQWLTISLST